MGVHPSEIQKEEPEHRQDYTLPIARAGEQQFAVILRNRSGMDAGEIDFGLRDLEPFEREYQDFVDIAFVLYETIHRRTGLMAARDTDENFSRRVSDCNTAVPSNESKPPE